MCVAIYKPAGSTIPRKVLEKCFRANPDGAGFGVAGLNKQNEPVLYLDKGFFTFGAFWKAWKEFGDPYQAVIHFRVRTHGNKDADNCHPFQAGKDHLVVHNGVLRGFDTLACGSESDTNLFVKLAITPIAEKFPTFLENEFITKFVAKELGGNRVIVLRKDGKFAIFNESSGVWLFDGQAGHEKVWFSNEYWKHSMTKKEEKAWLRQWAAEEAAQARAGKDAEKDYEATDPNIVALACGWGAAIGLEETEEAAEKDPDVIEAEIVDDINPLIAGADLVTAMDEALSRAAADSEYNDGQKAAEDGKPIWVSASGPFIAGYSHVVRRYLEEDEDRFNAGFLAGQHGAIKNSEQSAVWKAGWEWSIYMNRQKKAAFARKAEAARRLN